MLIRSHKNCFQNSSVSSEGLCKQQLLSLFSVDIMKWIVLVFFVVALSVSSSAATPVAAEYGACPEDEYNGENDDKSRRHNKCLHRITRI